MKNRIKIIMTSFIMLVSVFLIGYVGYSAKISNSTMNGLFSYEYNAEATIKGGIDLTIETNDPGVNSSDLNVEAIVFTGDELSGASESVTLPKLMFSNKATTNSKFTLTFTISNTADVSTNSNIIFSYTEPTLTNNGGVTGGFVEDTQTVDTTNEQDPIIIAPNTNHVLVYEFTLNELEDIDFSFTNLFFDLKYSNVSNSN